MSPIGAHSEIVSIYFKRTTSGPLFMIMRFLFKAPSFDIWLKEFSNMLPFYFLFFVFLMFEFTAQGCMYVFPYIE